MKDIVRIFQEYASTKGLEYSYGSQSHLNLLDGDLDPDNIYLLLFPVKRKGVSNKLGTGVSGVRYIGKFLLVKGSDYAENYFNENDSDEQTSKYTNNIEPLLESWQLIMSDFLCTELELESWECDDAINILDANKDGIWCSFTILQTA